MTLIRYWESVFFSSLFGLIALFPLARISLAHLNNNPLLFLLLSIASITLFLALLIYREFYETRRMHHAWASAFFVALTIISVGIALFFTPPVMVVWFIQTTVALFSFGHIIAKHFLRRIEHDFRIHAPRIILYGLAVTLAALLITHILLIFPMGLVALLIGGILFILFI